MTFSPRKLVVAPTDFSASSAPAVRTALEFVSDPSHVHVIHVIPSLNPVSPLGTWGEGDIEQQLIDKAMTYLTTWLASHNIEGVTAAIEIGHDGNRIVEYAEEKKADLIVIPSHGHSGLKRALLGSVAERVIRHADCPTLILRREE